jgi:hypothetical protein
MGQFYRHAHFSVGEQVTLPLYLHRCGSAHPYISSRQYLSMSTNTIEEDQSTIRQVSSSLLDLRRARTLKIKKLCVSLRVFYPSRTDCLQPGRSFCINNCCAIHLKVSVGTDNPNVITSERDKAATYPLPYFQALEELLADDSIQLRDLELDIVPFSRRPTGGSGLGFARHLWLKSTELEAEMHYDWSFLDKLPRNLRRVNIGIIEDTFTTRGSPNIFLLALQQVREKCQNVVAGLVELRDTDHVQEIHIARWSYVRCGKPPWYYSRPEHERKPLETGSDNFLCSRWETLSSLRGPRNSRADDIDSIVERSGVGDSIISQRTTSRGTVLRHVQMVERHEV